MSKSRSRAPIASLDSLVSRVRDQKAATPNSVKLQNAKQLAQASDSESDGSSSEDSDGSGSESEVDVEAARKKFAAKQQSKRSDAKQKSIPQKSQPTKSTPTTNSKQSKPAVDAEDSESDSDSSSEGSDSDDDSAQKPPATKGASKKNGAEEDSGSESESSSEEESEEETTGVKQSAKVDSSSEDDSQSSSSDDEEESTREAMDIDHGNKTVVNGNATTQSSAVSQPTWINNSNFVLRKASSDNPAKEVADFFKSANLEGKQVWYFTAPASLPITVLKDMEIDLSKATTGEALLNHNGDNYGLDIESHATSTQIQLLIPSQGGDKYAALNRGIDSTVHLRRIAKFGPGGTVSSTADDNYAPAPKAIREQPQGLKPRFTPIGVPTPAVQISTAAASKSKSSKKPKESDAVNGQLKRKHPEQNTNQSTPGQEPPTQGKFAKRPKTSKSATAQISSTPVIIDTPSKVRTPANKDQAKKAAKDAFKPTKQTPVPIPYVPSMNIKR